jgi:cardiolipin synthase A/B
VTFINFQMQSIAISILIIHYVLAIVIIVCERKQPDKTIAWVLIVMLLPILGILIYVLLGRNWSFKRLPEEFSPEVQELIYSAATELSNPAYNRYRRLMELLGNNSQSPLFINNEITIFKDGIEKFKVLKEKLLQAKHHIHIEYYIVKDDGIGKEIKDILIRKANEGVIIRFVLDRLGSILMGRKYVKDMRSSGIDVVEYSSFLTPMLRRLTTQVNYRNHRKIVVIDGQIAFTGGINIGDEYLGKGKLGYWRDTHIMIKGDFVLGLQGVFFDDFMTIKKYNKEHTLHQSDTFDSYFQPVECRHNKVMQLVRSGPDSRYRSVLQAVLSMISTAENHIYITTPYFVPTESLLEALKIASLSGIDVRILFPGKYDHAVVYYASRTYLYELIKCGVKVYLYSCDAFIHAKVITVDSKLSTVGTANMDIRSFELNYEINAVIYDADVSKKLEQQFFEDLNSSILLTTEDIESVPIYIKLIQTISRLFSYLL